MTIISDLSQDLIEEILSRVQLASQRVARSTCKQWNGLYKDESLTKNQRGKAAYDNMVVRVCDSRVCLVRVDLEGVHNNKDGLVEISTKLMDQQNRVKHYREGLSLKGNNYFVAQRVKEVDQMGEYLICFDFTSDRFRHCLDLNSRNGDSVILSSVRDEQLALLFYSVDTYEIEIQITTKIEANELTWINFLKVDLKPFTGMLRKFLWCGYGSFFVDEKKKVALIWDEHYPKAYLIGEDNYFTVAALGNFIYYWAVVYSYVPSSVQIQKVQYMQEAKGKYTIVEDTYKYYI
ncbi:putative F-box protein At3g19560 [Brassica napus]|uniref:putative F-box protein At3g19560 n=1 Tax=Brassica napus TaxID=3708 RepID=UPI002078DA07|nr:putative F-box protein At3g19560 [Brassica napus]